jgi:putative FmdB family regulatory protein
MPIYEYKCKKCGKEFEVFQRMTDPVVKSCGSCKGPVQKLVSMSSFHLKGSGWYVTDYGGKKPSSNENAKETAESTSVSESTSTVASSPSTTASSDD